MATKITFKKQQSSSWASTSFDIKGNKKVCGLISELSRTEWAIRFQVIKDDIMEDGNKNCPWKWITMKYKGKSADDAKQWATDYFHLIEQKYNVYFSED